MQVEIITIGSEILIGQIIDTNSAWMGQELNKIGVEIVQITSIGDVEAIIIKTIEEAKNRVPVILITGGLGPTRDDLTKKVLADYFQCGYRRDERTLEHIKAILSRRGIPLKANNIEQADVPEACEVMFNEKGTAPGMWFDTGSHIIASMPGVPYEMKAMMENFVLPRLAERFPLPPILHKSFLTLNIPESELSYQLQDFEDQLPAGISLAYLPHMNSVRLRLSAKGTDLNFVRSLLEEQSNKLSQILGNNLAGSDGEGINELMVKWLKERGITLATAESCTGGYIAHQITSVPGSSDVFRGSVVAYANDIKVSKLGVAPEILTNYGAVSEPCVRAMVEGVCLSLDTDAGIAVSGIAGPDGGSEEKPVGTVWIAVRLGKRTEAVKAGFHGGRMAVIERTYLKAMDMLKNMMQKEPGMTE